MHPGGNIAVNNNKTMLEEKGLPLPQIGWTMQEWEERLLPCVILKNLRHGLRRQNSFHYYSNTSLVRRSWLEG
ncbi:MAG: hypothetical protein R2856_33965 [Caldilineaceae bacterium]